MSAPKDPTARPGSIASATQGLTSNKRVSGHGGITPPFSDERQVKAAPVSDDSRSSRPGSASRPAGKVFSAESLANSGSITTGAEGCTTSRHRADGAAAPSNFTHHLQASAGPASNGSRTYKSVSSSPSADKGSTASTGSSASGAIGTSSQHAPVTRGQRVIEIDLSKSRSTPLSRMNSSEKVANLTVPSAGVPQTLPGQQNSSGRVVCSQPRQPVKAESTAGTCKTAVLPPSPPASSRQQAAAVQAGAGQAAVRYAYDKPSMLELRMASQGHNLDHAASYCIVDLQGHSMAQHQQTAYSLGLERVAKAGLLKDSEACTPHGRRLSQADPSTRTDDVRVDLPLSVTDPSPGSHGHDIAKTHASSDLLTPLLPTTAKKVNAVASDTSASAKANPSGVDLDATVHVPSKTSHGSGLKADTAMPVAAGADTVFAPAVSTDADASVSVQDSGSVGVLPKRLAGKADMSSARLDAQVLAAPCRQALVLTAMTLVAQRSSHAASATASDVVSNSTLRPHQMARLQLGSCDESALQKLFSAVPAVVSVQAASSGTGSLAAREAGSAAALLPGIMSGKQQNVDEQAASMVHVTLGLMAVLLHTAQQCNQTARVKGRVNAQAHTDAASFKTAVVPIMDRPMSAEGSDKVEHDAVNSHRTSSRDCRISINLYSPAMPASQVQMHAAASAALFGQVLDVTVHRAVKKPHRPVACVQFADVAAVTRMTGQKLQPALKSVPIVCQWQPSSKPLLALDAAAGAFLEWTCRLRPVASWEFCFCIIKHSISLVAGWCKLNLPEDQFS